MRVRPARAASALALLGAAAPAQAHLVSTGLGPLYDGVAHFLLSIPTLLPLLALLLWAALAGPASARFGALALPPIWALAAGLALALPAAPTAPALLPALVLLALGLLAALDRRWPPPLVPLVLAGVSALLGWGEGAALRSLSGAGLMLLGAAGCLAVVASLVAGFALTLAQGPVWSRVVLRVGGSWLGGIGLLLLGWQLRS